MSLLTSRHRGPRFAEGDVRELSIVGFIVAFVCFCVVVVVVVVAGVVVVVQPTIATIQTPKTSGINFFMLLVLSESPSFHNPPLSAVDRINP